MILYENNEIVLNEVGIATIPLILGVLTLGWIINRKLAKRDLLRNISKCYKNDYLILKIHGQLKEPEKYEQLLLLRKSELGRLIREKEIILVYDTEAYKILKGSFNDIEFFKILTSGGKIAYDIDEFIGKYQQYFKLFGEYRRNTNVESVINIFSKIDKGSLSKCARINLYWIGMLLRQVILHGKELGITKIEFIAPKVEKIENLSSSNGG